MTDFPTEILAALDPEDQSEHVFNTAVAVARDHGASAMALTILPPPLYIQRGLATMEIEFEQDLKDAVEAALVQKCEQHGLPADHAHVLRGHVDKDIGRFAAAKHVDLVCVGLHDRHGEEYFLGTTATGVLRHADAAILGCRTPLNEGYFRDVVIAVEADEHSRVLLEQASQFLKPYPHARLHVISVLRPFALGSGLTSESIALDSTLQGMTQRWCNGIRDFVAGILAEFGIEPDTLVVVEGIPSRAVKEHVEDRRADLLIMGTGRHVGFGWHIGSTTNNVMHGVQCNVLAIRPEYKASDLD